MSDRYCVLTPFGEMAGILDTLGVVVLNARRTQRLSARELAAKIGVSPSTICRIEAGGDCSTVSLHAVLLWLDGKETTA